MKNLFNLGNDYLLLSVICIFILLLVVFYPRDQPLVSTELGLKVGNLGGKLRIEAMDNMSSNEKIFALYYAPWCPHCKKMMPAWDRLISNPPVSNVKIIKINSDEKPELVKNAGVGSFPTIIFYPKGMQNIADKVEYTGDRTYEAFANFMRKL